MKKLGLKSLKCPEWLGRYSFLILSSLFTQIFSIFHTNSSWISGTSVAFCNCHITKLNIFDTHVGYD